MMTDRHARALERIRSVYRRRDRVYDPLDPWVVMSRQERERALVRWIASTSLAPVSTRRVIEIGCGNGSNLIELLRLGFLAENLVGIDLLPERVLAASRMLPPGVQLLTGDASEVSLAPESFDVVFQSMACSSILDDDLLTALAEKMWELVRPSGGVLWYDFTYDNPGNRDVRGLPRRRVRSLFPFASVRCWRLTLAPPLARAVTRLHPMLYPAFNVIPLLRTHLLCWLEKPAAAPRRLDVP